MRIVKPKRLKRGDLIGVISPSSSPDDITRIEKGVRYLESSGYKVIVGKNVGQNYGYLAGTDEQRIDDLHSMFGNREVKAVFCVRGGYGSPRLLDKIDYRLIERNPKIFVGYSDITALQLALLAKTGLITFAGPMIAVDFYDTINPYTEEIFWRLLTSNKKFGKINLPGNEKIFTIVKGKTKGKIAGGNLSTFAALSGTKYTPQMKNKILLLEEINEAPYRIDRMINQLRLTGILKNVSGVILGAFVECYESDANKRTLTLSEVIADYFGKLKVPVVYNFPHGHIKNNITVPIGINLKINTSRGIIEIVESAVM
jgi:muramoyltetrapeptide carboxypeptidase